MMASKRNGTLYTGVTSNLLQRVAQHREGLIGGFTKKHGIKRLVWFEVHETMESAIIREKRVKNWNRQWRIELIEKDNLVWRDLAEDFGFAPLEPTGARALPPAVLRNRGGDGFGISVVFVIPAKAGTQ
jgi:putative endonuclease